MIIENNIKGGLFPKGQLKLQDLINQIKLNPENSNSGAIITFTGITRNSSRLNDKKVDKIIIEAWAEQAEQSLHKIAMEVLNKHKLIDIRLYHGTGEFLIGEEMVLIVVSSDHRESGLQAIEELIHKYKTLTPIWKKEIYSDGSSEWISGQDYNPAKKITS